MTEKINFDKLNGLVPAIIQDANTNQVLMLGFMNRDALEKTISTKKINFWSRTRGTLWQKGETSGNTLDLVSVQTDCDNDALLIKANPSGPVCHTGQYTCFNESKLKGSGSVLSQLENTIRQRKETMPEKSYTATLFEKGLAEITQKVGEESIETIIAALHQNRERLLEETADLLYHILVLLAAKNLSLDDVAGELKKRM